MDRACYACAKHTFEVELIWGHAAQDEVFLNGTIVLPHKEIKETVLDAGTIIM